MAEDRVNALGSITGPAKPAEAGLAIVVPLFNEVNSLATLHAELLDGARRLASARGLATEVIYVDDGSRDATLATARRLAPDGLDIQIIALSRNFGKEAALLPRPGSDRKARRALAR